MWYQPFSFSVFSLNEVENCNFALVSLHQMFSNRYVTLGQICDQEKVQKEKKNLKIFEMKGENFQGQGKKAGSVLK